MNKKFLLVALFAAWCLEFITSVSFAQIEEPKTKVAIYTTGDVDASYKKVIGSKVTSVITQSSKYAAVERTADFLNALSQEHDYQRSGAVSDNQIVKIGQQFGVRYVVVLDISDLFGSLFISARMIDVRTGVIASSAEIGGEIQSMTKLIEISTLLGNAIVGVDTYKIAGPFSNTKALSEFSAEKGFHIASKSEIEQMKQIFSMQGKTLEYPILVDVTKAVTRTKRSCERSGYFYRNHHTINGTLIDEYSSRLFYEHYYICEDCGCVGTVFDRENIDTFKTCYIYLVKD